MGRLTVNEQIERIKKLNSTLNNIKLNEDFQYDNDGGENSFSDPEDELFNNEYIKTALTKAGFNVMQPDYSIFQDILIATARYIKLATRSENQSPKIIDLRKLVYDICDFNNETVPPVMSEISQKIFKGLVAGDNPDFIKNVNDGGEVVNTIFDKDRKTNDSLNHAMNKEFPDETFADPDEFEEIPMYPLTHISRAKLNEQISRIKKLNKLI